MLRDKERIYPDIFLAGAPKAGTTTLFDMLNEHPLIQGANNKEPAFYMDADSPHNQANLSNPQKSYQAFFAPFVESALHLDGSTQTMYQKGLAKELAISSLKPKFIFILRDPAERIYSSFNYTANNLASIEGISFEAYQELLLSDRLNDLKPFCKNERAFYSMSHELKFSQYHTFLSMWQKVLGKDQFLVLTFEQLKSDPQAIWKEVLAFLILNEVPLPKGVGQSNPTRSVRNPKLHYLLHQTYERMGNQIPLLNGLKKTYSRLQYSSKKPSMAPSLLDGLTAYFQPWNKQLADDFDVDISRWRS